MNSTIKELVKVFSTLKDNWDKDGAKGISAEVVNFTLFLIDTLTEEHLLIFDAAPGHNGEIMLDIRENEKSLELITYPDKKIAVKMSSIGIYSQSNFDESDLPQLLQWLRISDYWTDHN